MASLDHIELREVILIFIKFSINDIPILTTSDAFKYPNTAHDDVKYF